MAYLGCLCTKFTSLGFLGNADLDKKIRVGLDALVELLLNYKSYLWLDTGADLKCETSR